MKFTVTIKRHSEHESHRFQDHDPATVAAQLALWLNPTMADDVQWITVYPTVGVTGEPPREHVAELPDPHGPFPLPDDPFQQLEMGELEDLLEAITFATMEVPPEQRMRYASLALRVDRARIVKQEQDATIPDPNIMAINLEEDAGIRNLNNKVEAVNSASIKRDETITGELNSEIESLRRAISSRLLRLDRDLSEAHTLINDLTSANEDRIRDTNDIDTRLGELETRVTDLESTA